MGKNTLSRDRVSAENVEAKRFNGAHLLIRKGRIVEVVTWVMDLDSDRRRIEIRLAGPKALARVPRALGLAYHLGDHPGEVDEIMRGNLRLHVHEPVSCGFARFHARVVKDERIGHTPVAPRFEIGRRHPMRGKLAVRCGGHLVLSTVRRAGVPAAHAFATQVRQAQA